MSTVHDTAVRFTCPAVPRRVPDRPRHAVSWLLPIADGAVAGALAGSATVAALFWAPWWALEVVGFLTAPVLLVMQLVGSQGELASAIAIVGGTIALYCIYAEAILHSSTEETGALRFMALLVFHAGCLIVWIGMVIGGAVGVAG